MLQVLNFFNLEQEHASKVDKYEDVRDDRKRKYPPETLLTMSSAVKADSEESNKKFCDSPGKFGISV